MVEHHCGNENVPDVASAPRPLLYQAHMQEAHGNADGELAILDEIIERFVSVEWPRGQALADKALIGKRELPIKPARVEAVLRAYEKFDRSRGVLTAKGQSALGWRTARVRIEALSAQGQHPALLDALRFAYALANPRAMALIGGITDCVIELIAAWISECAVMGILSSEQDKPGALSQLVTAMRQRIGEEARDQKEVPEVASNIRKDLGGMASSPVHYGSSGPSIADSPIRRREVQSQCHRQC